MTQAAQAASRPDSRALRVGLIGQGIQRSRTPAMHRAEGAALGLSLTYDLIDTDRMSPVLPITDLLATAEAQGFAGLNVTYPFKKAVMAHLDTLSDNARKVGAVNTVVFRDGKRHGHNTDYRGFADGLSHGLPGVDLSCVLLLGAGGAGGAVAHALAGAGAGTILLADRALAAAVSLAKDITATGPARAEVATDLAEAAARATGVVNATPMGMAKLPGTAIDPALLEPRHWVCDIIYFPLETALLAAARARGCRTLNGSGMAVHQAVRAFELFTGLTPDPDRMRATFEAIPESAAD